MCGSPLVTRLVLAQAEEDGGHGGVERIKLDLAEESRSSFKNFDPRSLTNLAENTMEEGDGQAICNGWGAGRVVELR
jgi:hypothetical protein